MSGDGIRPGGVLMIAIAVLTFIAMGIDWLIEGHISKSFVVFIISIYVGLLLSGFNEKLDTIRDNTKEIKEQNEKLAKRLDEVERSVRYLNR